MKANKRRLLKLEASMPKRVSFFECVFRCINDRDYRAFATIQRCFPLERMPSDEHSSLYKIAEMAVR